MMTLEEMKAKQAADLAKLEREHALASLAPVPPRSVQLTSGGLGHWVSYRVPSLWEALDLARKFQPVAFYQFKGRYTRFVPAVLNTGKDEGELMGGPYFAKLDVSQGEGFGPTVYLAWFAFIGDDICMIRAELEREGFGGSGFGQYSAAFVAHPHGQSRRLDGQRYINGDFRQNNRLGAAFDKVTKWGSGSREGAHFQYAIMADAVADDESIDWTEAGLRLENVAEQMHGPRPRYRFKFDSDKMTGRIVRLEDGKESPELDKDSAWKLYNATRYGGRDELDAAGDAVEWSE